MIVVLKAAPRLKVIVYNWAGTKWEASTARTIELQRCVENNRWELGMLLYAGSGLGACGSLVRHRFQSGRDTHFVNKRTVAWAYVRSHVEAEAMLRADRAADHSNGTGTQGFLGAYLS